VGVSTPKAFAAWDELHPNEPKARVPRSKELTHSGSSDRLFEVGCALSAWLRGTSHAGAPTSVGGRDGSLLSDLVRAGIANDFESVVFSQLPELRDIKRALERAGSKYASLSGSGSTLYGLFGSSAEAVKTAERLRKQGLKAVATRTLTRRQYWKKLLDAR
jgi:4-diphosphocytidyl-2-C-methyl-D-erythritol kinase